MPRLAALAQKLEALLCPPHQLSPLEPVIVEIKNAFARDILCDNALREGEKNLGSTVMLTDFDARFAPTPSQGAIAVILADNGTTQSLDAWARDGLGFGRVPVLSEHSIRALQEVVQRFRDDPHRHQATAVEAISEILTAHEELKASVENADRSKIVARGTRLRQTLKNLILTAPDYQ